MSLFTVDSDKCNLCGLCAADCPGFVIAMGGADGLPRMGDGGEGRCIKCGHCVAICPTGAFSHEITPVDECIEIDRGLLPFPESAEHFMKSRRSVRVFKEEPLEHRTLEKLIDIARYAPSGHNSQPVCWTVVTGGERLKELGDLVAEWMRAAVKENPALNDTMKLGTVADVWFMGVDILMHGAPHLVVAHAPRRLGPLGYEGCIIALAYLELAAHSLGAGACWAGFFETAAVKSEALQRALGLPEGHRPYGAMVLGRPKNEYSRIPLRDKPSIAWL
ncbi:MAG: nitroreductase family protein [Chloroflexota bacterium]|nr:nitroreductase family protein [Chloroflexota bacterium]